jgi:hypothetical protein
MQPSATNLARGMEERAVSLLKALKGIADARVEADAAGRILRLYIVPAGIDERQAARNAQSAVMVVLGQVVDVNHIAVVDKLAPVAVEVAVAVAASVVERGEGAGAGAQVLELRPPRRSELNEAALVAFETLRAAQSSFHGFQFDGAELVRISGNQFVVVAVKRASSEVRHCGAAPVTESVGSASARALMNAVGAAAMNSVQLELNDNGEQIELLNA